MFEGLLKDQIRADPDIAGMLLSTYKGKPAFFFQKSPQDVDRGWDGACFPRIDYNVSNRYDPERKTSGTLDINIWCNSESRFMPEDIDKRIVELVSGTFYSDGARDTVCAIWNRSDAFAYEMPANMGGNTAPEVFGITTVFDILNFPVQLTSNPDPIEGLNNWTRNNFPEMTVINLDEPPPVWKPTDTRPAIYWRFEGTATNDRQSYAVSCYNGTFAAHVIAESATELTESLTNYQYEQSIKAGLLTFSLSAVGTVWVEQGINTLVLPGTKEDNGWKKIKRVKVRFELFQRLNDTVEPLVGRVNNDPDGRMTIIQSGNGVCNAMMAERKLLAGAHCENDPDNAPAGDFDKNGYFYLEDSA